ncbi:triphosphoribosyl-dephospho-CoA synthase [Halonotius roseus]|uniref:Triphosphoribosyl-dephospho-CoA synthase n=1 Tax=Halonotius roseus TaxID=2511997 RepID=A0A544QPM6_9EURY|nr:triphosphoribosyl-dephospho-CoA synthase [Halonotius roseus]TQQ81397.1 triphosphoribosyl-dephospho-CoA synthase [Halonotius roseus]
MSDDPSGSEPRRTAADNAQLALLLEVSATPKPGNVDRHRDLDDLRFEQFMAGAVGAGAGLRQAADGGEIGPAFERAVAGMAEFAGENTQFGCLLLLVPLVRAAANDALTPDGVTKLVEATTVDDAISFYRAFEHVDVAVGDPPEDADALDVRRGSDATETLRERELTLYDIMGLSADPNDGIPDGNAREWVTGFERAFDAADRLLAAEGPIGDRTARVFLALLAEEPDTLVAINHDEATARNVSERAAEVADDIAAGDDLSAAEELAEEFVDAGYNPGTTADLTAAALFIALERGLSV